MITRFDHLIIGVRDLDAVIQHYRELGFDVSAGGRHTGLGTHNAIIRFGLDYIELLSVFDEAEALASGPSGQTLVDYLGKREGGLVGYALAVDGIEQEAERFQQHGLDAVGPFGMERLRPDGRLLSWQLLVPGGVPWRRPWPFFIEWGTPDAERLAWEQPGTHANSASAVIGVAVGVPDLAQGLDLYQRQLGLPLDSQDEVPELVAQRASFSFETLRIDLLAPRGDGPLQRMLDEVGPGSYEATLAVADLDQARNVLTSRGITPEAVRGNPEAIRIPAEAALAANLVLTARR